MVDLAPLRSRQRHVCSFYGPQQGDLDNKLKSVLDAIVDLVIVDDNVKVVPHIAMVQGVKG